MAGLAPVARKRDHVFGYALAASVALHAAVLIGPPVLREFPAAPLAPPLQSRLVDSVVVPMPSEPVEPPKAKPRPRAQPVPMARPASAPAAAEAPIETPPPPAPPAAAAAPQSVAGAAVQASSPPDARSVGEYRVLLIGAAGRYKRYPALARENSWTGEVLVGVSVGGDGTPSFSVRKGSGHEVLDRQALDMFGQAARDVPVPKALRGQAFAFSVRAIYGLED